MPLCLNPLGALVRCCLEFPLVLPQLVPGPDITLVHGNHVYLLVDAYVTCPSVVTRAALPAACHMPHATCHLPLATAIAAYATKMAMSIHTRCCPLWLSMHAGGISKIEEGIHFFRMCQDAAGSVLRCECGLGTRIKIKIYS